MSVEPVPSIGELHLDSTGAARLTHQLFRYPAKFHPPVARALIERYSSKGDLVFDPFVGSGTLLVECAVMGRRGHGTDIDPLAIAVTKSKVHRHDLTALARSSDKVLAELLKHERAQDVYDRYIFEDLDLSQYEAESGEVTTWIPAIPRLDHWFRRYVVIDLAKIRRTIEQVSAPETHRQFLRVVFASIIRNASNADPVPVSGLEVTAHMRRRDEAGRRVNAFDLFRRAMPKALAASQEFSKASIETDQRAHVADATTVQLRRTPDVVITSPPYHGAVDYYRRHQLEMFWLGLVDSQADRLALLPGYIGRPKIPQRDPLLRHALPTSSVVAEWHSRLVSESVERANAFAHYMTAMGLVMDRLAESLRPGSPAIFVIGDSSWRDTSLPTAVLFQELAGERFDLKELLKYPIKNRYMSYSRHNGADIGTEFVLALVRT